MSKIMDKVMEKFNLAIKNLEQEYDEKACWFNIIDKYPSAYSGLKHVQLGHGNYSFEGLFQLPNGIVYTLCTDGDDCGHPIAIAIIFDGENFVGYIPTLGNTYNKAFNTCYDFEFEYGIPDDLLREEQYKELIDFRKQFSSKSELETYCEENNLDIDDFHPFYAVYARKFLDIEDVLNNAESFKSHYPDKADAMQSIVDSINSGEANEREDIQDDLFEIFEAIKENDEINIQLIHQDISTQFGEIIKE